jgi:hypothetical protein
MQSIENIHKFLLERKKKEDLSQVPWTSQIRGLGHLSNIVGHSFKGTMDLSLKIPSYVTCIQSD